MGCLAVGKPGFEPRLIIFDKDGTLIDFHKMWSTWIEALAQRLEHAAGRPVAAEIYAAVDYDSAKRCAIAEGALAIAPMSELRRLIAGAILHSGHELADVGEIVEHGWFVPDPVSMARPLTDLSRLFSRLAACGIHVAVVTSDDRTPTEATFAAFGLTSLVADLRCADDGIRPKPQPDMVLSICASLSVLPQQTMVVGDSAADMRMGMAAGVGLRVGVLSGVSSREDLAPFAEAIISSVADLLTPVARPQARPG